MARKDERLDRGLCPLCGRALLPGEGEGVLTLKDGAMLCSHCIRKRRLMYPLS